MKKLGRLGLTCIAGVMFCGIFVGCGKKEDATIQTSTKNIEVKKEESKDPNVEIISAIDNSDKSKITDYTLDDKFNPNTKDSNGQTIYSKFVNKVVKTLENGYVGGTTDYIGISDQMAKKGADKSLVKLDIPVEKLNDTQKMFLGSISIITDYQPTKTPKPIENKNFTMNGLELLSTTSENGYIVGKIKNNNSFDCRYVEVKAKLTDNNGTVLETPIDNITSLKSGETWSFKIPVMTQVKCQYNIIEMKCSK